MRSTSMKLGVGVLLSAAMSFGCGGENLSLDPVPSGDAGIAEAGDSGQEDSGDAIRTVVQRNPWGRIDSSNMLHDGDFELSGPNALQYVWMGLEPSFSEIGIRCRSGLRCARLRPSQYIAGLFVWPNAPQVEASFWAKPEKGECSTEMAGMIVPLDDETIAPVMLEWDGKSYEDGYCRFAQVVSVPATPGYHFWSLLIAGRSKAKSYSVVDDAMIRIVDNGSVERTKVPMAKDVIELSKAARARLRELLPSKPAPTRTVVRNVTGRRARE